MTTQTRTVEDPATRPVFIERFQSGFSPGLPDSPWQVRPPGPRTEREVSTTTSPDGLIVITSGTNTVTGQPCFTDQPDQAGHLRWAALANRSSSHGFPGFDVGADGLTIEAELSVEAYGLERHPYGDTVVDAHRDLRLAAGALITLDRESGMVFDFMMTDRGIYAVYEQLPQQGHSRATFSYAVPVADRQPEHSHCCSIVYSPLHGTVRWLVDGTEVLNVNRLGHRNVDAGYVIRDDGGPTESAAPRQLTAGIGLFADKAWGQGVALKVRRIVVSPSSTTDAP